MSLKAFADALPDYAKDLRLNLSSILNDQTLGEERKAGLLLTCAHGPGYKPLVEAVEAEVARAVDDELVELLEGAVVEEEFDALARRPLARLVLACGARGASAHLREPLPLQEVFEFGLVRIFGRFGFHRLRS